LYAEFAKVAEQNPLAWNYGKAETEETIGTVTKRNRMICFPCIDLPSSLLKILAELQAQTLF